MRALGVLYKRLLSSDGKAVGLVHEGVAVGGEEDERHEVLEQGAIPRCHPFIAFILHKGFVETEPMLVGSVALCNGQEAGKASFRGEVVVVLG